MQARPVYSYISAHYQSNDFLTERDFNPESDAVRLSLLKLKTSIEHPCEVFNFIVTTPSSNGLHSHAERGLYGRIRSASSFTGLGRRYRGSRPPLAPAAPGVPHLSHLVFASRSSSSGTADARTSSMLWRSVTSLTARRSMLFWRPILIPLLRSRSSRRQRWAREQQIILHEYDWAFDETLHPFPPGDHYQTGKKISPPNFKIVTMTELERTVKGIQAGRPVFWYGDYSKIGAQGERDSCEPRMPLLTQKATRHFADGVRIMNQTSSNPLHFITMGNIEHNEDVVKQVNKISATKRRGTMIASDESYKGGVHQTHPNAVLFEPFCTSLNDLPKTLRYDLADHRFKLLQRHPLDLKAVEDNGCPKDEKDFPIKYIPNFTHNGEPVEEYTLWFTRHRGWELFKQLKTAVLASTKQVAPVVVDFCFDEVMATFCIYMRWDYICVAQTKAHELVKKSNVKHVWWWGKTYHVPLERVSEPHVWQAEYVKYSKDNIHPFGVRIVHDFMLWQRFTILDFSPLKKLNPSSHSLIRTYNWKRNTPGDKPSRCKNAATAITAKRRRMVEHEAEDATGALSEELDKMRAQSATDSDAASHIDAAAGAQ
ncbi:unnamed protein product [Amoebophrya sp. A25]|nr:unnamed protein product [Amoebophrya sp. A25]|eukprot:GSA25T00000669001.1